MSTQQAGEAEQPEKTSLLGGFREFLMRGNVVELAVAVVVGTAFSKIVDAVVKGLINPLVGAIGTKDLDVYETCISPECGVDKAGEPIGILVKWGPVVSAGLTFLITAAVVYFLMILPMARYKERRARKLGLDEAPAEVTEVDLLTEIRDALVLQRTGEHDDVSEMSNTTGTGPEHGAPREGATPLDK
ncbi:large conductance mechanosensitive channel protein MscL [Streptomyces sp. ODS28]|uniref:large conductance mechanosensitive channel protein MscL n=1 Tax=Streptomyces sp. ODS28 TaxID=3136688 RepID=UPI0031E504B8